MPVSTPTSIPRSASAIQKNKSNNRQLVARTDPTCVSHLRKWKKLTLWETIRALAVSEFKISEDDVRLRRIDNTVMKDQMYHAGMIEFNEVLQLINHMTGSKEAKKKVTIKNNSVKKFLQSAFESIKYVADAMVDKDVPTEITWNEIEDTSTASEYSTLFEATIRALRARAKNNKLDLRATFAIARNVTIMNTIGSTPEQEATFAKELNPTQQGRYMRFFALIKRYPRLLDTSKTFNQLLSRKKKITDYLEDEANVKWKKFWMNDSTLYKRIDTTKYEEWEFRPMTASDFKVGDDGFSDYVLGIESLDEMNARLARTSAKTSTSSQAPTAPTIDDGEDDGEDDSEDDGDTISDGGPDVSPPDVNYDPNRPNDLYDGIDDDSDMDMAEATQNMENFEAQEAADRAYAFQHLPVQAAPRRSRRSRSPPAY